MLYIIQSVPDPHVWEERHLQQVLIEDNEEMLPLVGLNDIGDDVLSVHDVDPETLDCLGLVPNGRNNLIVDDLLEGLNPGVVLAAVLVNDPGMNEPASDQEVLVDEVQQVLQVHIHIRLSVDCLLVACQEVVELNYSDRYRLKLLGLDHQLSELDIFNQLRHNCSV